METAEILRDLDIDLKSRLSSFTSREMKKLLATLTESLNKQKMAGLLCDGTYFDAREVLRVLEKTGGKRSKLMELLDEPKDESQMRESVAADLRAKKYEIAYEVPLPKKGRQRRRKIDVAGYKKGLLGGISVIGVELKSLATRSAIDSAFGQAKDYSDWCEESVVCFSPFVYYKYADAIADKIKKHRELGVWIVSKRRVVRILQDATATSISDKKQKEMVDFITPGKG